MGSWEDYCEFCDIVSYIRVSCTKCGISVCEECRYDYLEDEICNECKEEKID